MSELAAPGKKVKDYKVIVGEGETRKLSELTGKKGLVLYFYPRDNTPGCTKEACGFRDNLSALKRAGYGVVGVSPDSPASHKKFSEKFSLPFPLISDESHELSEALGVWQEKKNYGKTYMGIVRSTFLLDAERKILKVYGKVKPEPHAAEILEDLKDLRKEEKS